MALILSDATSSVLNWLQTSTDAGAAAIRALVYNGATNILEAGDVDQDELEAQYQARYLAGATAKVLYVTVWDAGERVQPMYFEQPLALRVIDRGNGYRRIRAMRDVLKHALSKPVFVFTDIDGRKQGVLRLEYTGRTGYRQAAERNIDFEAVTFVATIDFEEET